MLIGIDGNEANVKNRVGSNQYAYGIIKGLSQLIANNNQHSVVIYLKQKPLPDLPPVTDQWRYKVIGPSLAWTQWRLPLELYLPWGRPEVFYSPGHYAPRFAPMPSVVSIMDLAFLKMPQLFLRFKRGTKQLKEWTEYSVKQAAAIIAISEYTKKDIVENYHISPEKIYVAYPGVDMAAFNSTLSFDKHQIKSVKQKYHLPNKYILHLGTLQPRKNIVRLIQAFERLPQKYHEWQLVLAGQSGWLTEDIAQAIKTSKYKDRIIQTGYVEANDVPVLLAAAGCLCMVGLYEGFGMPPAEALACGTIPIVSNNTSLPEVVGDNGILVDPYSVASLTHGIMVVLDMPPSKKEKCLEAGQQYIKKFNWLNSAKVVLDTIINSK